MISKMQHIERILEWVHIRAANRILNVIINHRSSQKSFSNFDQHFIRNLSIRYGLSGLEDDTVYYHFSLCAATALLSYPHF